MPNIKFDDQKNIYVTKTFLPPISEFTEILNESWEKNSITNGGALQYRLMDSLKDFLKVPNILTITNGTIGLQIAIKTLKLKGEIITTPFSYIATSSAIIWEGCTPVYADIDPTYWCIDPSKIEERITPKTTAIIATHIFGNPCDIDKIQKIAQKHNLKVIYDAAHCFGVNFQGESLLNYGDISMCSFHATKLFHTAEGGCLVSKDVKTFEQLIHHHNFGHNGEEEYHGLGINGKSSELQSAMGLSILPYINKLIAKRKQVTETYDQLLSSNSIQKITIRNNTSWNYSYYPIVFQTEELLKKVKSKLNENHIFPRRYFYPSLNKIKYINKQSMPISESISNRILCLPLYDSLMNKDISRISTIINEIL